LPELPEVERSRALLARHLEGRTIRSVATVRDPIVYAGVTGVRFARGLRGRRVLAARRKGKHLWLELDRRPWPAFHFGMDGRFHVYEGAHRRPRFWKVELTTSEGLRLAMTNARRLGRIRLLQDPPSEPPISELGFDPLLELPAPSRIAEILARRSAPIKAVLLDQSAFAGVGNWIADEVLYQAAIDPRRRARTLTATEVARLRSVLHRVIRRAVAVDADSDRFPRTWLFHHRWGRRAGARTAKGRIAFHTIGGRTTAWVPAVQG
jgi:formamidopyrimidine-DNA glycosylase